MHILFKRNYPPWLLTNKLYDDLIGYVADHFTDIIINKTIPYVYKCNSEVNRVHLLNGIYGYLHYGSKYTTEIIHVTMPEHVPVFSIKGKNLMYDIIFLVRSIGLDASVIEKHAQYKILVHESMPIQWTITPLQEDKENIYYGFELSGNGRYLLNSFIVTHNTSCIKAISNVSGRHIINVRLSEITTNNQINNLFYNPVLHIVNPDTLITEKYIIPIHQRLYIIEDIDCMTDLVKRRNYYKSITSSHTNNALNAPKSLYNDDTKSICTDMDLDSYYQQSITKEKDDMKNEEIANDSKDKITLDSLLNILDGTLEIPSRMLCITTNYLDIIDPALIRPGRIDIIVNFKKCNRTIIRQMFESFYEKAFDASLFIKIREYKISPAVVNQVLFKHLNNATKAISELIYRGNKKQIKTEKYLSLQKSPPALLPLPLSLPLV
jgi:hypothetical protein